MTEKEKIFLYIQDKEQYDKRKFLSIMLPDNYFMGIPSKTYTLYRSTNTSNKVGYDSWYFTPGIGTLTQKKWIVKESNPDLENSIIYIYRKEIEEIKENCEIDGLSLGAVDKIINEFIDDKILNDGLNIYNKAYSGKNWTTFLLMESADELNAYVYKFLKSRDMYKDFNDKYIKALSLYSMNSYNIKTNKAKNTILQNLIKEEKINNSDLLEILGLKNSLTIVGYINRFRFYHHMQLCLQLSHELWDILTYLQEPVFKFIINNDWIESKYEFVIRQNPLEKIILNEELLRISSFDEDEGFKSAINDVFKWKPEYYDKFVKFTYLDSVFDLKSSLGGMIKFILD